MTSIQKQKGPATAPTVPSHGSTYPGRENAMNDHDIITDKADPAILSISIDPDRMVDECDADAQQALYDAFKMAGNALEGFLNQPRCHGDGDEGYNQAGEVLCDMVEFFDKLRTRLVEDAVARPREDVHENKKRLFMILAHEFSFADEMEKCAAMAGQFVYEQAELVSAKRRAAARISQ